MNRLAELLEMSGLSASFSNNNDGVANTGSAKPLPTRTPVRPGLMMLESTPGLITGMSVTSRNSLNDAQSRRQAEAGTSLRYPLGSESLDATSTRAIPGIIAARTPGSVRKPSRRPPPPRPVYPTPPQEPYFPRFIQIPMDSGTDSSRANQIEAESADVRNVSVEAVMEEMRQFVATPAKERLLREAEVQRAMAEMKYEVGLFE